MNVDFVLAFLGHKKTKASGEICSHVELQKHHDAIQFGSNQAQQSRPTSHCEGMDEFLSNYKKETAEAKKHGNIDEEHSDPTPWSLFRLILK